MDEGARKLLDATLAIGRVYHRISAEQRAPMPDGPVLFVANHGFGGVFDLNVLAFASAYDQLGDSRDVAVLTHQIAWTLGVGPLLERLGSVPANHGSGLRALRSGKHALVFPGGDIDGFKSWTVIAGSAHLRRAALGAFVARPDLLDPAVVRATMQDLGAPATFPVLASTVTGDPGRDLQQVHCPTRILRGAQDALSPPGDVALFLSKVPSAVEVRFDHTGHWPHIERPRRFVEEVHRFVSPDDAPLEL